MKVKSLSRVRLFATPWTAAYQAPPSMGFSRQEYWSGVPLPSPNPALGASQSLPPLTQLKRKSWRVWSHDLDLANQCVPSSLATVIGSGLGPSAGPHAGIKGKKSAHSAGRGGANEIRL